MQMADTALRNDAGKGERGMKAKDVMTPQVISVQPDNTVGEVAERLLKHGVSAVPVVEGDRIVGIVSDVRNRGLNTEPRSAYYVPQTQVPFSQMVAVAKTTGDPRSRISAVTKVVNGMDQDTPLFDVKTMQEYLGASVATPRFSTTLLSIFAGVALVLTVVGLYGVMSYSVAQRTNEIGIRLALGAQTRDVLLMVIKHGSKLILIGLAIGLAAAFALTRWISSLLFGVTAKDPFTFAAVAVLLAIVALIACYVPALRATKVDPMDALRCE